VRDSRPLDAERSPHRRARTASSPVERARRAAGRSLLGVVALIAFAGVLGGSTGDVAAAPSPPIPPEPALPVVPGPSRTSPDTATANPDVERTREAEGTGSTDADDTRSGSDVGAGPDASIDVSFPNVVEGSSNSVVIILLLTVLSVAPSVLVLCTSFTRIVIVLSLTRNALGIPAVPPNQVIVGLAVFLTLFVMGPTLSEMNEVGLSPLLDGRITTSQALEAVQVPLREFLLEHTREGELELFLDASGTETPVARGEVPMTALIPAFVLSELKSGFIIGFVIFVPFLVIDLVVSAVLMGLGMMMLPPSFVALPFKLLLFVMLDGWTLVTSTLLTSYG
jgi:flagellar biosynthetic protein FliP